MDIAAKGYQTLSSNKSFYKSISPPCSTEGSPDSENVNDSPTFIPPCGVKLFEESSFTELKPLGTGGECMVYMASIPNGWMVAVKVYSKMSQVNMEEVEILLQLPLQCNIVKLIGLYTDAGIVRGTVTKYMEGGSLESVIHGQSIYDTTQINKWMLQAARGIAFLHENSVVHRDVKPANILLSASSHTLRTLKISNLGYARDLKKNRPLQNPAGTWPYMAPEVLINDTLEASYLACASDVFSFGITLWELLCRRKPVDPKDVDFLSRKRGNKVSRKYWTEKTAIQKWRPDLLEPFPEGYQYFSRMWCDQPQQRITMSYMLKILERRYDEETKQEQETLPLRFSVASEKRKLQEEKHCDTMRNFEHKQFSELYCEDVETEERVKKVKEEMERLQRMTMEDRHIGGSLFEKTEANVQKIKSGKAASSITETGEQSNCNVQ